MGSHYMVYSLTIFCFSHKSVTLSFKTKYYSVVYTHTLTALSSHGPLLSAKLTIWHDNANFVSMKMNRSMSLNLICFAIYKITVQTWYCQLSDYNKITSLFFVCLLKAQTLLSYDSCVKFYCTYNFTTTSVL